MHILKSARIPEVWLPLLFSFEVEAFGTLDAATADLPFNGPAGLPLHRPRPLVVPLSDVEVFDFPFADGFRLLAAFRRSQALSSLGSLQVSNALHVFLTQ